MPIDATVVRGLVLEQSPGALTLGLAGTEYRLRLAVDQPVQADGLGMVAGRLRLRAARLDRVGTGGSFIEPLYGRPRRVQGRLVAVDARANTVLVHGPCPVVVELPPAQKAAQFSPGELVGLNAEPPAWFEPAEAAPSRTKPAVATAG